MYNLMSENHVHTYIWFFDEDFYGDAQMYLLQIMFSAVSNYWLVGLSAGLHNLMKGFPWNLDRELVSGQNRPQMIKGQIQKVLLTSF